MQVKVVVDNNGIAVYDTDREVVKGSGPAFQRFAQNVIKKGRHSGTDFTQYQVGHKQVFEFQY